MFRRLLRRISGRLAVAVLSVVIIVHIGLMMVYLQSNRIARETVRRDAVIQKIINAISLVEATPISIRPKAVSAMADPKLQVSLTSEPQWDLRFHEISLWNISRALQHNLDSFQISIQLEKNQWLNLNATIYSQFLYEQLSLLFLEIIVLGSILVSAWSINRFTQPLAQFKSAAEKLGIDIHATPLQVKAGPAIVQEVAEAMNQMQQRIQDLIRDRTQMLAAISHDLRTPITRMKLRLQLIDGDNMQDELSSDLDEMERMVNETLSFARDDSREETMVQVDLVSLLSTITNELQDMGRSVVFESALPRAPVSGRPLALKRAFVNLINNGVRYGQSVSIKLSSQAGKIIVRVDDQGPGIPEADMERVFQPFFRLEHSRSRHTGGVGLGLAVTRDIFQAHRADIQLRNRKPKGLQVLVTFELD